MPFESIDAASVAHNLSQIASRDTTADVFLERSEVVELPADDAPAGVRWRREEGLAVRLIDSKGRSWSTSSDEITSDGFRDAVRRVARSTIRLPATGPDLSIAPWPAPVLDDQLVAFRSRLHEELRQQQLKIATRIRLRSFRRHLRVIGVQVSSTTESEHYFDVDIDLDGQRYGLLTPTLDDDDARRVVAALCRLERSREAPAPAAGRTTCVLGHGAAAVLLHEAVAHALEADVLARSGHPEAAIGVRLGSELLDVFDDPTRAAEPIRRQADDEGYPVARRCLLRAGVVEQPLADGTWSRRYDSLMAGCGRRSSRHEAPAPRSMHLEMVVGDATSRELMAGAEGGLYLPEAEGGKLDPVSGRFQLRFAAGLRIRDGAPATAIGACVVRGHVTEFLQAIQRIGCSARAAGAGWCAKDGMRLPVWATAPEILVGDVEVVA